MGITDGVVRGRIGRSVALDGLVLGYVALHSTAGRSSGLSRRESRSGELL